MEFRSENEVVDAGALKILGEGVEIAARVGERRFAEFRRDKSAALDTNFEAVQIGNDGAQGFVSAIKALQKAGMLAVVDTCGTQQQMKCAERANELGDQRLSVRGDGESFDRGNPFLRLRSELGAWVTPLLFDRKYSA
jgi:hypothetical protein